jgi:hypothetical protein
MNLEDVSKREILDFKKFRSKVMDDTFKPLAPENQDPLSSSKTGLHKIKREAAYDWVGYANAVFSPEEAGITFPGFNSQGDRDYVNGVGVTTVDLQNKAAQPNSVFNMDTSESEKYNPNEFKVIRLNEFKG